MLKKTMTLIFIILAASSCSLYSINYEEVTDNVYKPKKSPNEVAVMEEVSRPFDVVGYITVNTERCQNMDEVREEMKKEAAVLGGDAITNIKSEASGPGKKNRTPEFFQNAYIRKNYTATVIAFK